MQACMAEECRARAEQQHKATLQRAHSTRQLLTSRQLPRSRSAWLAGCRLMGCCMAAISLEAEVASPLESSACCSRSCWAKGPARASSVIACSAAGQLAQVGGSGSARRGSRRRPSAAPGGSARGCTCEVGERLHQALLHQPCSARGVEPEIRQHLHAFHDDADLHRAGPALGEDPQQALRRHAMPVVRVHDTEGGAQAAVALLLLGKSIKQVSVLCGVLDVWMQPSRPSPGSVDRGPGKTPATPCHLARPTAPAGLLLPPRRRSAAGAIAGACCRCRCRCRCHRRGRPDAEQQTRCWTTHL